MGSWVPYQLHEILDVDPTRALVRMYIEHRDTRAILREAAGGRMWRRAAEFGCGFGRMTQLLCEFSTEVHGFEREPSFVETGRRLVEKVHFHQLNDLGSIPLESGSLDCSLSFVFLQHLTDRKAEQVLGELRRLTVPGGVVLLCEETDPDLRAGDIENELGQSTIGRPVEWYQSRMQDFELLKTAPRRIEPSYPRADVGTYMLFGKTR